MAAHAVAGAVIRRLYLSPHFDDAVLSCGGLIAQQTGQGDDVLVVTICAGHPSGRELSPFAEFQHQRWLERFPDSDLVQLRRAEDEAACQRLGARLHFLHELDCIYRVAPDGRWMYDTEEALWADLHPDEDDHALAEALSQTISDFAPDAIYAPLAVGNHVDHQRIRERALSLANAGHPIWFYEDYPYSEKPEAVWRALNRPVPGFWQRYPQYLTTSQADAKMDAIACYESQLGVLFAGKMCERVMTHLARVGAPSLAEVLWKLAQPSNHS
ncbi:MAG: PIG-L family deacetylase [Caldilineales bacterium]|nr:PIG-L family deacetylase [Caldilineales bacterium]